MKIPVNAMKKTRKTHDPRPNWEKLSVVPMTFLINEFNIIDFQLYHRRGPRYGERITGTSPSSGYDSVHFRYLKDDYRISVHALMYVLQSGAWPDEDDWDKTVHHINGDRNDNRLENLELITISENNKRRFNSRKTPYKGVGVAANGKYYAAINYTDRNGERQSEYKYDFDTPEEANEYRSSRVAFLKFKKIEEE